MNNPNPAIPLFDLNYGREEKEAVLRVLRSKWLTMGPETEALENEFAGYFKVKHALAVSSCTTALHLANLAVGVKKGTNVICPSFTFVATSNSVLYAGGIPVFADIISTDDWTISPNEIKKKIKKNTRAIIVMHYGGFACKMDEIIEIAKRNKITVIEDAAHAPGSFYKDRLLGSTGDISCFSFFSNKNISTGEGGMICTNNDDYANYIKKIRSHGMTSATWDRHHGHAYSYDVTDLGYNYRIDEIHAALARCQLKKLKKGNERRRLAAIRYKNALSKIDKITIPFADNSFSANYHIFPILLNKSIDRHSLMVFLRGKGIQTSIHYPPVHKFSYYKTFMGDQILRNTDFVSRHELTLPMHAGITGAQIDYVVDALINFIEGK
ncbi:MAG: DegT/DnrJ/EryC1/StrS aminotransferase family protein [Smithella sp.]|nr:DegT/DnrJ/EryC1/StrS aminotransferase family protein [Smithella sp.]